MYVMRTRVPMVSHMYACDYRGIFNVSMTQLWGGGCGLRAARRTMIETFDKV